MPIEVLLLMANDSELHKREYGVALENLTHYIKNAAITNFAFLFIPENEYSTCGVPKTTSHIPIRKAIHNESIGLIRALADSYEKPEMIFEPYGILVRDARKDIDSPFADALVYHSPKPVLALLDSIPIERLSQAITGQIGRLQVTYSSHRERTSNMAANISAINSYFEQRQQSEGSRPVEKADVRFESLVDRILQEERPIAYCHGRC